MTSSQASLSTNATLAAEILATRGAGAATGDARTLSIGRCRSGADHDRTRRRPEAVVMSYEQHLQLARGRGRVRAILERHAADIGADVDADDSLELATLELDASREASGKPRR